MSAPAHLLSMGSGVLQPPRLAPACCWPARQASALDQFKSFVASTKAAKGEFTQRR
jgi:hypothetical protein